MHESDFHNVVQRLYTKPQFPSSVRGLVRRDWYVSWELASMHTPDFGTPPDRNRIKQDMRAFGDKIEITV